MTIGVLVPSTRANMIISCLKALEKQTRRPDGVVVTIPSSDGKLYNAVDSFSKTCSLNIKKIVLEKPGVIAAINNGINFCDNDILCFIDDDAQARPNWIEQIEAYYRKDEKIGAVGGRDLIHCQSKIVYKNVKKIGHITWYGKLISNHHNAIDKPVQVKYLKGCNMSCRRKLIEDIDTKLETKDNMAEPHWELDIAFGILKRGYNIWFDPDIIVDHYPGEEDYHITKRAFIAARNQTYLMLKHLPFFKKIIYVIYTFFLGDKSSPGILFLLIYINKPVFTIKKFSYKLKGAFLYLDNIIWKTH